MLQYFKENKYGYYQNNNVGAVYIIESSNKELINKLKLKRKQDISKTDKLFFLMDSFVGATDRIEFAKDYNRKEFVNILIDNEKQLLNKDISFCFAPLKYGDFETWISNISSDPSDEILSFISSNKDTFKGYTDEIIDENDLDFFAPKKIIEPILSTTPADGIRRIISTKGNTCLINGVSGLGKTKTCLLFISSALNKYGVNLDTLGIDVKTLDGLVVHFDTEQDKATIIENADKMIFEPLGMQNKVNILKQYKPQSLVGLSPIEMMRKTERKLDALYKKYGKIDMIVIDGAIDYTEDYVSDAKQSSIVASKFKFFADLYDCLVIQSMHLNPSRNGETNEKPAGVLGSQLERKAESSIVLVKQPKTNTIKVKFNKHRKSKFIPELEYRYNDKGLIESIEPTLSTEDILDKRIIDILTQYTPKELRQSKLIKELENSYSTLNSEATIKRHLKELNNGNIVVSSSSRGVFYSFKSDEIDKKFNQQKLVSFEN